MNTLFELVNKYGSDKNLSQYTKTYEKLFTPIKEKVLSLLEVGVGTLDPSVPSTFAGNVGHYKHYTPGGSLRVWRDFFPHAKIYGVDIAKDCLIKEERIKTFLFDSSNHELCANHLTNLEFDIIIDDGCHDPAYQIKTLRNLFPLLNQNGYYIIEDIGGYAPSDGTEKKELLIHYLQEFNELTQGCDVTNCGNHIVIKKTKEEKNTPIENNIYSVDSIPPNSSKKDFTLVTGLWNIGRNSRDFETHYLPNFDAFLKIDAPMVVFVPSELKKFVEQRRSTENTHIICFELDDVKRLYSPFWNKTQEIRTNPNWYNLTGEHGWLKGSPQASLEWYNPIVQSKMFLLHDAVVYNPFDTDYFFWLDAGITNTIPQDHLVYKKALDNITSVSNPFLFISYPYESSGEIHGFKFDKMNELAREKVTYVCRGGLFGGHKYQIREANATYYSLLMKTLSNGLMGTEESIFTIMSYTEPHLYRRYMIDGNGLISKFTQALIDNNVVLEEISEKQLKRTLKVTDNDIEKVKTNLYILTFNFPEQLSHTIESMKKVSEWLNKPKLVLLDNSTDEIAKEQNKKIADEYNFEYIHLGKNTGICGGRQYAAEHFHESDADFMFFFEDDMTSNPPERDGEFCRNGFRKFIPNLYNIVHKIMIKEEFDFLKLSYTEVFMDNNIQVSWYNVPQDIRTRDWPSYDKLPFTGLDPNAPRTQFNTIEVLDGVSYVTGDIYYANWPMIVSKNGNKKMFIDTKWAHPYEQTWMSYMYQETKKGNLRPALLLASPINHDRIAHYKPEERREN
jgi:hypothetical protein